MGQGDNCHCDLLSSIVETDLFNPSHQRRRQEVMPAKVFCKYLKMIFLPLLRWWSPNFWRRAKQVAIKRHNANTGLQNPAAGFSDLTSSCYREPSPRFYGWSPVYLGLWKTKTSTRTFKLRHWGRRSHSRDKVQRKVSFSSWPLSQKTPSISQLKAWTF